VPDVVGMLGTLRSGMYEQGRGTWLVAEVVVRPGADVPETTFGYDQEPHWRRVPPPIGFRDELATFPRADEHIPAWLRQRLSAPDAPSQNAPAPGSALDAATPTQPGASGQPGGFGQRAPSAEPGAHAQAAPPRPPAASGRLHIRTPRVHDGFDKTGRAVVRRMPLSTEERERVLSYLDGAPVVLAARGYAEDAFDPDSAPSVPLNFRTDGTWVWPGAVAYYLRVHSITPDPDLVEHIRARQFVLPEVDEPAKQVALAAVTGGDELLDD
jgi:hypothetical protein